MARIAMIGAGSVTFAGRLLADLLSFPELGESTVTLMDVRAESLDLMAEYGRRLISANRSGVRLETTGDRRRAIDGADYVIVMFQIGGVEPFRMDIEIPRHYGVDQTVGDTLGPGGIFRGLRTIPVFIEVCRDVAELSPGALLINYTNPMAILCWAAAAATPVRCVGLCHSVQHTSQQLAHYCGIPDEEVGFWVAGINHMAWFLRFERRGQDAYPLLREAAARPEVYDQDRVRFEIFKHFGYFNTESSHHMSEYVPYFRKTPETAHRYLPQRWDYPTIWSRGWEARVEPVRRQLAGEEPLPAGRSAEYGMQIIHSMETGTPRCVYANVSNAGYITNLPIGACVEVPCLVDRTGVHPCHVGDLPTQCAALNLSNINVQGLTVEAALSGDRQKVQQAVALDPLSSAVLTLDGARAMTDELLAAERPWLPQFGDTGAGGN